MKIGVLEARTKLSALLDRVERGEEFTITRRGRPVAQLVPVADDAARWREASEALKALRDLRETLRRRGVRVTFDEIKHWIEKGRL
jgi:prevent-host-death family protein